MPRGGTGTGCPGLCSIFPTHTRTPPAGEESVSHREVTQGGFSWEVLDLGCLCGFLFHFSSVRCPARGRAAPGTWEPVAPSHQLEMEMSSGVRAYCFCWQPGVLDPTSQGGNRLFLLKQASNKELFPPNISQLFKNQETHRFPKSFCSLSFSSSHRIP